MAIYGSNYDYGESPRYKDEGEEIGTEKLFYFLPNWKYPVSFSYEFETPLSITRRKREQRKPLRLNPVRSISFTITEKDDFEEIWNYLISLHAESLYLPIYNEPCKIIGVGSLLGTNFVNTLNFLNWCYNLKTFCEYMLLIDLREIINAEIISYAGSTHNSITFGSNIIGDFPRNTTVIYPLLNCYLVGKERQEITDRMTKFDLTFWEY